MERKIRYYIAICLCVSLLGLYHNHVYAYGMTQNGDIYVGESALELLPAYNHILLEQKQEQLEQIELMDALPSSLLLNITRFQQQNDYYCGPATVKQVVNYINGSSQTQNYYALALGTTTSGTVMANIPGVLNSSIGQTYYAYEEFEAQDQWMDYVRYSIYNGKPAVLDINTSSLTNYFPYNSTGHFVNVHGYDDTTGRVWITDPATGGDTVLWYPQWVLYSACDAHPNHAIIW